MSAAEDEVVLGDAECDRVFEAFRHCRRILIALSGGPDSTALAWLAMRWRTSLAGDGPELIAATVDHGLRPDSRTEAESVGRWCAQIGLPHHILTWHGEKPSHGIQEAARSARYEALLGLAHAQMADALAVAHTLDDQAETVLFRLSRGSGLSGLAAMRKASMRNGVMLLRPFLDVPKARLIATLKAAQVSFVQDPSNANPRFSRVRLRALAPVLEAEGLDARRLSTFAARMARADAALEAAVDDTARQLEVVAYKDGEALQMSAATFATLPDEIALRLLGRAISSMGHEGPVELGKLEELAQALLTRARDSRNVDSSPLSRTLAGAQIVIKKGNMWIFPAPPRRKGTIPPKSPRI